SLLVLGSLSAGRPPPTNTRATHQGSTIWTRGRDDDAVSLGSFRSDISGPVAALIFVHGFNCPVDWACMRLGQLLTLGKFSSKILPLVFSWPTGTLSSFFHVRPLLPDFAADLPRFLRLLSEAGLQEL
ncbi:unnamed protein product, partial [Effrenium voratum]